MNSKQYTGYAVSIMETENGKDLFLTNNGHIVQPLQAHHIPGILAFLQRLSFDKECKENARTIAAANKNRDIKTFFMEKEGCIPSVSRLTLRECKALYGEYYLYCVRKGKKACNASKRKKTQAIYSNRSHYMGNIRTLFHDRHNTDNARARIATMIGKVREYNAILARL
jgi:hypothetical protein